MSSVGSSSGTTPTVANKRASNSVSTHAHPIDEATDAGASSPTTSPPAEKRGQDGAGDEQAQVRSPQSYSISAFDIPSPPPPKREKRHGAEEAAAPRDSGSTSNSHNNNNNNRTWYTVDSATTSTGPTPSSMSHKNSAISSQSSHTAPSHKRGGAGSSAVTREEAEAHGQASTDVLISASKALESASEDEMTEEQLLRQARHESKAGEHSMFHPLILCTLTNLGNSCYFNSGVQILCNCPEFVFALRDAAFVGPTSGEALLLSRTTTVRTHALYRAFAQLLWKMEHQQGGLESALSPHAALDQLGDVYPAFAGRSQQDCPEMITAVIGNTEEEGRQDVEVDVVLRGFEDSAKALATQRARYTSNLSPAVRAVESGGTLAAVMASSTTTVGPPSVGGATKEPFTPSLRHGKTGRSGGRSTTTPTAGDDGGGRGFGFPTEAARLADEEMSTILPVENGVLAMPGVWSAHEFAALRLMQSVNASNAALERRIAERKGKPFDPLTGFRPPKLLRNSATDGFKGYTLSEITCGKCGAVSRIVEPFTTLMLDVPSQKQRAQFAKRHPEIVRRTENGELLKPKQRNSYFCWYNPLSYFYCLYKALAAFFAPKMDYNLTLQECLDIHFEAAELKGSNQYKCDSCNQVCEATKKERLVALPEYLVVHMKRFEAGQLFGGKKNDPVIFPVSWSALSVEEAQSPMLPASVNGGRRPEILDLKDYMHPDVARFVAQAPPCLRLDDGDDKDGNASGGTRSVAGLSRTSPLSAPSHSNKGNYNLSHAATAAAAASHLTGHMTSTYTLDGVVNHHGSLGGGHYTVYVRKTSREEDQWVYISDDVASAANLDEVANSEEYLLLYRKQPMVQSHGAARELRDKARYYLLQAVEKRSLSPSSGRDVVYISRDWLHRAAFFADPGAIHNKTCYCAEQDRRRVTSHLSLFPVGSTRVPEDVPHVHGPPADWFYVPIEAADYWAFYAVYGGDGPCTQADFEAFKADQAKFLAAIRRASAGGQGSQARTL